MNRVLRFFKTSGVYFLGNSFTKLVSFFLLPIYTNKISPVSYGEYGLSITFINVIVPIVFLTIWDSVFRFSFDYKKEEDKYKVMNNGFIVMLFGSIILILSAFFLNFFVKLTNLGLICLYAIAMGFQYYYTVITRALQDNILFVISGCVNSCISILLNIVLIIIFEMDIKALYISYIIGVAFQIIIIEYKKRFLTHVSLKLVQKSAIKGYLRFSVPVTFTAISSWLLNGLTQLFITYLLGSYYNGLYNVANKFASIFLLGIGIFQFAWNEMAYDLTNDDDKSKYYKRSISEILRFCIIGVSVIIPVIKLIYPIMIDVQYNESLIIIPILLIGTMACSYAGFLGTLFMAEKSTFYLLSSTLIAGVINLIGLNILIPLYGFIGALISLCLSYVVYAIIRIIILKEKVKITPYLYSIYPVFLLVVSVLAFYVVNSVALLIIIIVGIIIVSFFMMKSLFLQSMKFFTESILRFKR